MKRSKKNPTASSADEPTKTPEGVEVPQNTEETSEETTGETSEDAGEGTTEGDTPVEEPTPEETPSEETSEPEPAPEPPQPCRLSGSVRKHYRHEFTDAELAGFMREQASLGREKTRLEEEKKSIASDYKARVEAIASKVKRVEDKANDGYEMREIECFAVINDPKPGQKTFYRQDNGGKLEIVEMSHYDKQFELPLGDQSKAEDKPTIPHRQTRGGVVAVESDGDDLNDHTDKEDY